MPQRPNLLLIMTDQQRADTIGSLGNPVIRTPALDRLVREGTAFTSAYTPSAECVPARACLTFGQYPARTGCFSNGMSMPWETRDNLMAALSRAGTYTAGIGKCHFTPASRTFEKNGFAERATQEELVADPNQDDYHRFLREKGYGYLKDPHGVRGEMYYIPQPAQMPAALHPTQWVGDRAVDFLSKHGHARQPWFLFASFIHPHPPFAPPAPWHKLYRDAEVPFPSVPPESERRWVFINHVQNRYKRRDRGWDLHLLCVMRAYYYACISFVDFQIGRMLQTLEHTGQLDHTLMIVTSDHGELLGDHGCFGKRSYHDAATRIPLLVRGPDVPRGLRCDRPVTLLDVTATLLNRGGASFQTHTPDGDDLLALAADPDADRTVFSQWNRGRNAIFLAINRRWKFVYSAPDQRELLFDRRRDPDESRDLAGLVHDPDWTTSRAQRAMRRCLQEALKTMGETTAMDGDEWRLWPVRTLPPNPDAWLLYQDHAWADQQIPGYTMEPEGEPPE